MTITGIVLCIVYSTNPPDQSQEFLFFVVIKTAQPRRH